MINDRRLRSGYSNLGSIKIPPQSQAIILTDRGDGTLWLVSFNASASERLSISSEYSTIQRLEGIRFYEANDGPKMDEDGEFTLIIRDGHIGFQYDLFPRYETARDDSPPYARTSSSQRELIMDSVNPNIVHIGYKT